MRFVGRLYILFCLDYCGCCDLYCFVFGFTGGGYFGF